MTAAPPAMPRESSSPHRDGPLAYVRRLARQSRSSFYYAFLILPRPQREGIIAVYAFCRIVDNAVDEAAGTEAAAAEVARWRDEIDRAFRGAATHPAAVRAGEVAREFGLPRHLFDEVLDGVASDLAPRRFRTFEELAGYCDLVAGAVGRLSVRIFGLDDPIADIYAQHLGLALQLTNILRDLGPDAAMGRFYLPLDDLERFALSEPDVLGDHPARVEFLRYQADRAASFFEEAGRLGRRWPRQLCSAEAMAAIYRSLLGRIRDAGFPSRGDPVRVPTLAKAWLAGMTWARCRVARTA